MTDQCLTCDAHFTPPPMHPMITPAHCPECLPIVRWCCMERHQWVTGRVDAQRSENV